MKPVHRLIAVAAIAALSACSTVMTTSHSGYLSDYSALAEAPDAATASRAATQAIDPASVLIAEVVWRVEARPDIRPDERDAATRATLLLGLAAPEAVLSLDHEATRDVGVGFHAPPCDTWRSSFRGPRP